MAIPLQCNVKTLKKLKEATKCVIFSSNTLSIQVPRTFSQNRKCFAFPFKIYHFIHGMSQLLKHKSNATIFLMKSLLGCTVCDINFKFLGIICKTFTIEFYQGSIAFQLRQEYYMLAFKTYAQFQDFGVFLFLFPFWHPPSTTWISTFRRTFAFFLLLF